jgi:hypothetical protein
MLVVLTCIKKQKINVPPQRRNSNFNISETKEERYALRHHGVDSEFKNTKTAAFVSCLSIVEGRPHSSRPCLTIAWCSVARCRRVEQSNRRHRPIPIARFKKKRETHATTQPGFQPMSVVKLTRTKQEHPRMPLRPSALLYAKVSGKTDGGSFTVKRCCTGFATRFAKSEGSAKFCGYSKIYRTRERQQRAGERVCSGRSYLFN